MKVICSVCCKRLKLSEEEPACKPTRCPVMTSSGEDEFWVWARDLGAEVHSIAETTYHLSPWENEWKRPAQHISALGHPKGISGLQVFSRNLRSCCCMNYVQVLAAAFSPRSSCPAGIQDDPDHYPVSPRRRGAHTHTLLLASAARSQWCSISFYWCLWCVRCHASCTHMHVIGKIELWHCLPLKCWGQTSPVNFWSSFFSPWYTSLNKSEKWASSILQ